MGLRCKSSPNLSNVCAELHSPSPSPSPRTPALVVSNSSKSLVGSNSAKSLLSLSNSGKALLLSSSGKKKYVKQVTGRHNDTELHLAAQRGDVASVRLILEEIDAQMLKTMSGAEFDAEVAEIRSAMVNEVNELGETALFTAAERGYIDVVKELIPYTTKEGISTKNRSGFDPLHIAANQGHEGNNIGLMLCIYFRDRPISLLGFSLECKIMFCKKLCAPSRCAASVKMITVVANVNASIKFFI